MVWSAELFFEIAERSCEMAKESRTIEIEASPEVMFRVITDFKAYPEFLAHLGMNECTIEKDQGKTCVVTNHLKKLGASVAFTIKYEIDEARKRLSWTLVKAPFMSKNDGSWELTDLGDGRTRATYEVEVKFGFLVPQAIVSVLVSIDLPALMEAFKKRAESLV
jgi:coenzyme Q-binding protein COQ10